MKKQSISIGDDHSKVEQVATISANNDAEVGKLIAEATRKAGKESVIRSRSCYYPPVIIALYLGRVISGTFPKALMILALVVLVIFAMRALLFFVTRD